MRRGFHPAVAYALHADDVVAGFGEAVHRFGVAFGVMGFGVAVGADLERGAAVAEVPGLVADLGAEGPHLERHWVAGANAKRWRVCGMDRGRERFLSFF